jgi:single-strand DNA-binding protein
MIGSSYSLTSTFCNLAYSHVAALLLHSAAVSERNPLHKHPEWDIPADGKALIGAQPVSKADTTEEVRLPDAPGDMLLIPQLPVPEPDEPLDIPSLVRLFQTDAYPIPENAPLRITVGEQSSLTLYPHQEALEYRQQSKEHTIYLRASKAGEVAFSFTPTTPSAGTQEPLSPPSSLSEKGKEETLLPESLEPGVPQEESSPPTSTDWAKGKEKKERVSITGRVGRVPTFKTIKTGLMAKFPVAEHQPDGSTTTWRTIVAFGKTAEALRDTLTKGDLISIAGYPHNREITGKSGQTRTVTEIYLAGLKHHK